MQSADRFKLYEARAVYTRAASVIYIKKEFLFFKLTTLNSYHHKSTLKLLNSNINIRKKEEIIPLLLLLGLDNWAVGAWESLTRYAYLLSKGTEISCLGHWGSGALKPILCISRKTSRVMENWGLLIPFISQ